MRNSWLKKTPDDTKKLKVKSQEEERTSLGSESELSDGSEADDEITEPGHDESDSFEMNEDSDY